MITIAYPFWLVTRRIATLSLPVPAVEGYMAVFTSAVKAAEYMAARAEGNWELALLGRPAFLPLIPNLEQIGFKGICLDPAPAGPSDCYDFQNMRSEG